jgi:hypothetical protein
MAILIQEMVIASSAKNMKNINLQKKINYFPFVYDRFKIDSTRFKKSNFYYTSKVEEYEEILEKVTLRLEAKKDKYAAIKKVKDSIKKDSITKIKDKNPIRTKDQRIKIDLLKDKKIKPIRN